MSLSKKPDLRQRVYTSIDKLSDRSTLSQALSDLEHLTHSLSSTSSSPHNDSLSTFLSCITSIDTSHKPSVRVHCINLLSLLFTSHEHEFPLLSSQVTKTIIPFLLRRLRDGDSAVRSSCSALSGSVSDAGYGGVVVAALLGAVFSEQEGNTQIGICQCLTAALEGGGAAVGEEVAAELRRVVPRMVKMVKGDGFKAKAGLLGVIGSVIKVNHGWVINGNNGNNNGNNGGNLVGNVVGCAVEMMSCEDWAARKAAAEVLEAVVVAAEKEVVVEFKGFVVGSLESRRFDKVKITRETMNRALEAWKEVLGGPDEDLPFARSNSSLSKGGASPPISRRSSFAGWETPKPKKTIAKTRSSLSDGPVASISSSVSVPSQDTVGLETPQRKKTMTKTRSSLSDDSTITDSSSVSKSSQDVGFETPQSKKSTVTRKKSLPKGNDYSKKSLDWRVEIALPPAPSSKVAAEEVTTSGSEMRGKYMKKPSEERVQKGGGMRYGSRVVPFVEEEESNGSVVEGAVNEHLAESNDADDLSLIRNQLLQIERQQSSLLDLVQRFMGNSQSGIDSLETRVSGLERALDEISYDLAVQSGRIPNNDSAGSTCCPSTEFLSPKFWRRAEGRSSTSKSSCSGSMPNYKDGNTDVFHEQNEGSSRDSWGSVRTIGQNAPRGRTCSPRSFEAASTAPFMTPVVRGT